MADIDLGMALILEVLIDDLLSRGPNNGDSYYITLNNEDSEVFSPTEQMMDMIRSLYSRKFDITFQEEDGVPNSLLILKPLDSDSNP